MKNIALFVLMALISVSPLAMSKTAPDKALKTSVKGKKYTGKAIFLNDRKNSLIVKGADSMEIEFTLVDTAKILQNGQQIPVNRISTKADLVVVYKKKKGDFLALRVEQILP